jgi:hypothetical protein
MIDTLICGALTPFERRALHFARDYGLATTGHTSQPIFEAYQHLCERSGIAVHKFGWTEAMHCNICAADLTVVLSETAELTADERNVAFSAHIANAKCVVVAPGVDWLSRLKAALAKPELKRLYITGGNFADERQWRESDDQVVKLLTAIFNFLDPRDPGPSVIPEDVFDRRIAALRQRYAGQFRDLPDEMVAPEPGWLDLLEKLCADIDALLPPDRKAEFHWLQIKEKFGGLRAYWSGGPLFVDIQEPGGVVTMRLTNESGPQGSLWEQINGLIDAATVQSETTCGDCGAPGRVRRRNWIRTLCDLHSKPGWNGLSQEKQS